MDTANNTPHKPQQPHLGLSPRPVQRRPAIDGFVVQRRPTTVGSHPMSASAPHMQRPVQQPHAPAPTTLQPPTPKPQSVAPAPKPIAIQTIAAQDTHRPAPAPQPQPVAVPVRPLQPVAQPVAPSQQQIPAPHPVNSVPTPTAHPVVPAPTAEAARPQPTTPPAAAQDPAEVPADKTVKPPKERSSTGHAGLVGFATFLLLGALFVSPLLPGKVLESLPLGSQTFSSSGQSLGCLTTPTNIKTTTKYNSKDGLPITYKYAATTTQSADCDGKRPSATTGYTSLFSPIALAIDVVSAVVVAVVVGLVWRLVFSKKKHRPQRRNSDKDI